jgi:ribonuclease HII
MPPNRRPSFRREAHAYRAGRAPVAGCDEAGRGPWAGPVVAAAVILDPARVPKGLNDSKLLAPDRREELFLEICACAEVSVALRAAGPHRPRQYSAREPLGACARGLRLAAHGRVSSSSMGRTARRSLTTIPSSR